MSPPYTAVILECVPPVSADVLNVAVPELKVPVPLWAGLITKQAVTEGGARVRVAAVRRRRIVRLTVSVPEDADGGEPEDGGERQ